MKKYKFKKKFKSCFFELFCLRFFSKKKHCKSLPKNAENFDLKVKNTFEIHFWSFKIIFEPKINLSALKGPMVRLKNFFFWHFDQLPLTFEKKKRRILQFWPKISSNSGISDVDIWSKIWPIGPKKFGKKYSSVLQKTPPPPTDWRHHFFNWTDAGILGTQVQKIFRYHWHRTGATTADAALSAPPFYTILRIIALTKNAFYAK